MIDGGGTRERESERERGKSRTQIQRRPHTQCHIFTPSRAHTDQENLIKGAWGDLEDSKGFRGHRPLESHLWRKRRAVVPNVDFTSSAGCRLESTRDGSSKMALLLKIEKVVQLLHFRCCGPAPSARDDDAAIHRCQGQSPADVMKGRQEAGIF